MSTTLPVQAPAGSLTRIEKVVVCDTFGDSNEIASLRVKDGGKGRWRLSS
ncbi:hypothetical protein [Sinisalibacter aestuarii]|uniref:Uncharacterized protein n=1 Tax=Sinisalibacter aestuarii TaxID=2949426 RepID=A0ABQ5LYU5_9RHOB|nr:hypothetical protein [Sinisalibacter aestuarii]GKY89575.1 hypothetical protein STA1M1_34440 [Sinisalibacter aestuarii]